MNQLIAETPRHLYTKYFMRNVEKWCLGVSYVYTGNVFTETPRDTTILSNVSQRGSPRHRETPKHDCSSILHKGGVSPD